MFCINAKIRFLFTQDRVLKKQAMPPTLQDWSNILSSCLSISSSLFKISYLSSCNKPYHYQIS